MKTKKEIISALARTEDDRLLLAQVLDKAQECETRGYLTHTRFLNMTERAMAEAAARQMGGGALFWGGYEGAERAMAVFYPDYLDEESAKQAAPVALLRAHKRPGDELTHRDYLGALMGLQIDRAMIGDIVVHEAGADLLVSEEIADFLLMHFDKAGRKRIELTREPIESLRLSEQREEEGQGSVASPRLDSVIALIFGLSRANAQAEIARGPVFVNGAPCLKDERELREDDRLTVRGRGRARIVSFGGISRKGRLFVTYAKSVL